MGIGPYKERLWKHVDSIFIIIVNILRFNQYYFLPLIVYIAIFKPACTYFIIAIVLSSYRLLLNNIINYIYL